MKNRTKLIIAIVLALLMLPTMGVVYVKDSLHSSGYCAACHADPYYQQWAEPTVEYSLAHVHAEMGVSCQNCHERSLGEAVTEAVNYVTGNYYYPFEETSQSMGVCFTCHESYAAIIPPTDTQVTGAVRNPHNGHWGELECSECHNMHRDSVVYCDICHEPFFDNEPGWE